MHTHSLIEKTYIHIFNQKCKECLMNSSEYVKIKEKNIELENELQAIKASQLTFEKLKKRIDDNSNKKPHKKKPHKCPVCEGDGVRPDKHAHRQPDDPIKVIRCDACNKTGIVWG